MFFALHAYTEFHFQYLSNQEYFPLCTTRTLERMVMNTVLHKGQRSLSETEQGWRGFKVIPWHFLLFSLMLLGFFCIKMWDDIPDSASFFSPPECEPVQCFIWQHGSIHIYVLLCLVIRVSFPSSITSFPRFVSILVLLWLYNHNVIKDKIISTHFLFCGFTVDLN